MDVLETKYVPLVHLRVVREMHRWEMRQKYVSKEKEAS